MKILIISHEASITGAPKVVFSLAKALERKGHSIKWLFGKGGPLIGELSPTDYHLWYPDLSQASLLKRVWFNINGATKGYISKINKWFQKEEFDLIINNTVMNGEILSKLTLSNAPVVSVIHEMETVLLWAESTNKSVSKTLDKSNYLIVVSEPVKTDLIRLFAVNQEKITIIPGYADIKHYSSSKTSNEFIVGGCGSLIHRKGVDQFLAAARILKNEHAELNIKFIWVGGIENTLSHFEFLNDLIKLGLEENVSIVTQTKEPEKYFSKFDLFFMSSREDPFPLVNMEVAKFGIPMICFDKSGGSVDFAQQGGGLVLPYLQTEKVVETIVQLYSNKELYTSLSNKSQEVGKTYSKEEMEPVWMDYFEKIIQ
jgi:glycosyltransferase involved in cell wall biosynthesis